MDEFIDSINPLKARHDWLNGHWRRKFLDTAGIVHDRISDQIDFDGRTQEQLIQELRSSNGEDWYRQNRVRLENPDVWAHYLSLN